MQTLIFGKILTFCGQNPYRQKWVVFTLTDYFSLLGSGVDTQVVVLFFWVTTASFFLTPARNFKRSAIEFLGSSMVCPSADRSLKWFCKRIVSKFFFEYLSLLPVRGVFRSRLQNLLRYPHVIFQTQIITFDWQCLSTSVSLHTLCSQIKTRWKI